MAIPNSDLKTRHQGNYYHNSFREVD